METNAVAARVLVCSVAFAAMLPLVACSSSKHPAAAGSTSAAAVTRWWSNAAATAGSTINPADPGANAGKLQPSQADYCTMLRQTTSSKTVLAGLQAGDPTLLPSVTAFVDEIEKVAPASVSSAWQVLGPVIINAVKAGPASVSGLNTAANVQAAQTVASDAQAKCGVDLSKVITGATK